MLKRWTAFTRFLEDGRICLSNNAAERALRWLFAGSDRGGDRAAVMYTLIGTAKLNNVDPEAWQLPTTPPRVCTSCSHGTGRRSLRQSLPDVTRYPDRGLRGLGILEGRRLALRDAPVV